MTIPEFCKAISKYQADNKVRYCQAYWNVATTLMSDEERAALTGTDFDCFYKADNITNLASWLLERKRLTI